MEKKFNGKQLEKGQSMVELAVSFIVLMILLAGVVDLGRLAFYYIAMRDAAQEGASYASIFPNQCDEIISRVETGTVDTSRIEVTLTIDGAACEICPSEYEPLTEIVVTVKDEHFPITMPLIGAFVGNEISLETTIRDNIIRVPECAED